VEPLSAAFTPAVLKGLLAGRSTRIKPLLLDQALIAGLGNIYVDEALWHAKIHPERPATSVKPREAELLHGAIQEVLTKSITLGGSSFRDYRNGYGQLGGNQVSFAVYQRGGEPCQRCGGLIQRLVVAQRGTHICPTCQAP
jgi:formamidopyrimidine-DNA glycosylase